MIERVTHLLQIGRETLVRLFSEFIIKKRLGKALNQGKRGLGISGRGSQYGVWEMGPYVVRRSPSTALLFCPPIVGERLGRDPRYRRPDILAYLHVPWPIRKELVAAIK